MCTFYTNYSTFYRYNQINNLKSDLIFQNDKFTFKFLSALLILYKF